MFDVQVHDFNHWRKTARELLQRNIDPSQIQWQNERQHALFDEIAEPYLEVKIIYETVNVPAHFLQLIQLASCFRDEAKWGIFYHLAYRIAFEQRDLLNSVIDADVARLQTMCKRVSRDKHKMKAFVRFKKIHVPDPLSHSALNDSILNRSTLNRSTSNNITSNSPTKNNLTADNLTSDNLASKSTEQFIAWFEPSHLIVESVAPFFTQRFCNMHFAILTPDRCMYWDTKEVRFGKGVPKPEKIEDELENLWCEYYANIFNPARVKLKAMQSEMPKKYWVNLPEAHLIQDLTRNATNQMDKMITRGGQTSWHKTQKSRFIQEKQKELRKKAQSTNEALSATPSNIDNRSES